MFSVISIIAMRQLLFHITIFIFILGIFQVIDAIKNVTFYDLPVAALFLEMCKTELNYRSFWIHQTPQRGCRMNCLSKFFSLQSVQVLYKSCAHQPPTEDLCCVSTGKAVHSSSAPSAASSYCALVFPCPPHSLK